MHRNLTTVTIPHSDTGDDLFCIDILCCFFWNSLFILITVLFIVHMFEYNTIQVGANQNYKGDM